MSIEDKSVTDKKWDPVDELRVSFREMQHNSASDAEISGLIRRRFDFPIDGFQQTALTALAGGQSVVLSAPTGSGKTLVGEMAIYLALCQNSRIFYTTPLKALSNQKYYDFKMQFGEDSVGLLTGDVTLNREAEIVVMTTEVYRNMLYADSGGLSDRPNATEGLFAVVFDEFHFLNDRDRGTVWEESVINSPAHVLLVALSATMSNAPDVRDWFAAVQGPTALVESSVRPVPLSFSYFDQEGMTPLFEAPNTKHTSGKGRVKGFKRRSKFSAPVSERPAKLHPSLLRKLREARSQNFADRRRNSGKSDNSDGKSAMVEKCKEVSRRKDKRRGRSMELPSFPFVVRGLRKRDMLPCIVFVFSRAGCDRAAVAASNEKHVLVSSQEQEKIRAKLDAFVTSHPGMVQDDRIDLALQGIASHHAGLLPLWKICIEEMFQEGLIKVVFATETLAAGINMPARTTVISSLSKRIGSDEIASLTTSEVLQMAGRAGRRGKDTVGYSVLLKSRNEGPLEAFKLLTAPVDALESKFTPSFGMVLNQLGSRPIAEARKLIDRSFGNFLRRKEFEASQKAIGSANGRNENSEPEQRERTALETVLNEARDLLSRADEKSLRSYAKTLERVKAERRALEYVWKQGEEMNAELVEETLAFAPSGTMLMLREKVSGRSTGNDRRHRRRKYSAAVDAAAKGDRGAELKDFYLGDSDQELDLLESNDTEFELQEIEAILLDMHSESLGVLPMFVAVDANGVLRMFNHNAVTRLMYDHDPVDVDALAPGWRDVSLGTQSDWDGIGVDQFAAPLPDCFSRLPQHLKLAREAAKAAAAGSESSSLHMPSGGPEIHAQRKRLEHAKQLVQSHEMHGLENTRVVLAARRAIPKIEATLDGRSDPFGNKRRLRKRTTNNRPLESRDSKDSNNGTSSTPGRNSSWDDFMALVKVLQHYGFLDEDHSITSLGTLGAKVRSDNELWTSLVLMEPGLEHISPVSLGAALGSTLMDTARTDVYVGQEATAEVKQFVSRANAERMRLLAIQTEHGVDVPLCLDSELMGLVELWASGVTWVELLSNTSLQEGDVCRILRRTLDLLRQIHHLPVVSSGLKRNAKRAIALLDRFPITDDRTYTIRDNEKMEDSDDE